jgi:hypothetical protein
MQMLDYNVPGGKLNRGMAVYDVLAAIKGAEVIDQMLESAAQNMQMQPVFQPSSLQLNSRASLHRS